MSPHLWDLILWFDSVDSRVHDASSGGGIEMQKMGESAAKYSTDVSSICWLNMTCWMCVRLLLASCWCLLYSFCTFLTFSLLRSMHSLSHESGVKKRWIIRGYVADCARGGRRAIVWGRTQSSSTAATSLWVVYNKQGRSDSMMIICLISLYNCIVERCFFVD